MISRETEESSLDMKTKLTRKLMSMTSDQVAWNRRILKWRKSFKTVEKTLNGKHKKE